MAVKSGVLGDVGVGSAFESAIVCNVKMQATICILVILTNRYWLLVGLYGARGLFNALAHASLNAYFAQRISPRHLMNIRGGWGVGTSLAGFLCGVLIMLSWGWEPVYLIGGTPSFITMGLNFWARHHFSHLDVMPAESLSGAFQLSVPIFFAIASSGLNGGLVQGVGN